MKHIRPKVVMGTIACLAFVVVGVFVISLYLIPTFTPFGMGGVFVQSKYVTYSDPNLKTVLQKDNLVIESQSAEIYINVRAVGQRDEGRVQVFENANGISFNSVKRTQVYFYNEIDLETGTPYSKILVREPKGMVAKTTKVYINLKSKTKIIGEGEEAVTVADDMVIKNIKLDTGKSNVFFDTDETAASDLTIENLHINGTGRVNFLKSAEMKIGTLNVNDGATVNCEKDIERVRVKANATLNLKDVTDATVATGGVIIEGGRNILKAHTIEGALQFKGEGTIDISGRVGQTTIRSNNVAITAAEVYCLDLRGVDGVGLCGSANVNISKITGGILPGNIKIEETSTDGFDIGYEVDAMSVLVRANAGNLLKISNIQGNTVVEKRKGGVELNFAQDTRESQVVVRAVDGDITVTKIYGFCDIATASAGHTSVKATFRDVKKKDGVIPSRIKLYGGELRDVKRDISVVLGAVANIKIAGASSFKAFKAAEETNKEVFNNAVYRCEISGNGAATKQPSGTAFDIELLAPNKITIGN